jgi:hypothetical protein
MSAQSSGPVHLFPSGVETGHYATSRQERESRSSDRKVAGYVGVVDERVDLALIGDLAAELPDWTIRIVGPITKIDPDSLPKADNIEYPGIVHFADTAVDFAQACLSVVEHSREERDQRAAALQRRHDWDVIASEMSSLLRNAERESRRPQTGAVSAGRIVGDPPSGWSKELELAHGRATAAATAGMQDPALAGVRLAGPPASALAEAAVSSATPFLRAPLLARVSAALLLHPVAGDEAGFCPTCEVVAPCPTARALRS